MSLAAQIAYDPAVYSRIAATAVKIWKALPNKGAGEQLSKTLILSLLNLILLQLRGHISGDVDTTMPVIKQLDYENANKYCQEATHPIGIRV